MSITKVISAVGNNNSIYPLLIRDCGIENPVKVAMTYNQNKSDKYIAKNAVRERIIDEYATSAIWLGGIPLVNKISDKIINKLGFNPKVSCELLNNDTLQNLNGNIQLFKEKTPDAVNDLLKIKNNLKQYKQLQIIKLIASIAIPTAFMGFILPKLNFALTKKVMKKNKKSENPYIKYTTIEDFEKILNKKKSKNNNISFSGNLFNNLTKLSTVQKMAVTDMGLSVGRVSTARNKNEKIDNAVKMTGMMYLNYIAPKQITKGLNFLSNKLFKLNVNLDPMLLNDNDFINAIKSKTLEMPKSNMPSDILKFIDSNPESVYTKAAEKIKLVKLIDGKFRDPRAFINIKDMSELNNNIADFSKMAFESGNFDKFIKKARSVKNINVLANIIISSALLAFFLPKVQYFFRKIITKNKLEPGLVDDKKK